MMNPGSSAFCGSEIKRFYASQNKGVWLIGSFRNNIPWGICSYITIWNGYHNYLSNINDFNSFRRYSNVWSEILSRDAHLLQPHNGISSSVPTCADTYVELIILFEYNSSIVQSLTWRDTQSDWELRWCYKSKYAYSKYRKLQWNNWCIAIGGCQSNKGHAGAMVHHAPHSHAERAYVLTPHVISLLSAHVHICTGVRDHTATPLKLKNNRQSDHNRYKLYMFEYAYVAEIHENDNQYQISMKWMNRTHI